MEVLTRLERKMNSYVSERERLWLNYVIIFAAFVEGMALVSGILSQRPVYESVLFTVYQVAAILIPGLAYVELLKVKFCTTGIARIFLAYAVGYGSNIVIYYILYWLGNNQSNAVVWYIVLGSQLCVSIFTLIKRKTKYLESGKNFLMVSIFVMSFFGIELFTYCGNNMMPPYTDGSNVERDLWYWLGNTVALKQDYPPVNFRTLEEGYAYHFFSSIQIAVSSLATQVDVITYSICYSYIQAIFIMVGGFYCLMEKQIHKRQNLLFMFIIFFFISGYEDITRTNWAKLILVSPFGFDYGLGLMMYLLLFINVFFVKEFSYTNFFLLNFILAILMGVKSPFACIGIVGIGIGCLYELSRKKWKKAIGEGITALLIFGSIYFFVVNISGYAGGEEAAAKVISVATKSWEENYKLGVMRDCIMNIPLIPGALKELLYFVCYIFLSHPCMMTCAVICMFTAFKKKRRLGWTDIAAFLMVLTGMVIGVYIYMGGDSQVYFVLATYPVILLWMSRIWEESNILSNSSIALKYGLALCVGGYLGMAHAGWNPMVGYASVGRYNFMDAQKGTWNGEGYVSHSEYEVLEYIKKNIPKEESILYVNERSSTKDQWVIAGVIAEHLLTSVHREIITSRSDLDEYLKSDYDFCVMNNDLLVADDDIVFLNGGWAIIKVGDLTRK